MTLIASDPRISASLFILSISKMILIYLNYKLWLVKWKVIYTKILDTVVLDRNEFDSIKSVGHTPGHRVLRFISTKWFRRNLCNFWKKSWCVWYVSTVSVFMKVMNFPKSLYVIDMLKIIHKKVPLWFTIAFINFSVYFIILDSNLNSWKWHFHNCQHRF